MPPGPGRQTRAGGAIGVGGSTMPRMALLHRAELRPTKLDLLAAWLPSRRWFHGPAGADIVRVAGFRFDDPAGEVGIETILVRLGDGVHQVPLTYRGAPLDGADDFLVGTTEHSVLGRALGLRRVHRPGLRGGAGRRRPHRHRPGGGVLRGRRRAAVPRAEHDHHRQRRRDAPVPAVVPPRRVVAATHAHRDRPRRTGRHAPPGRGGNGPGRADRHLAGSRPRSAGLTPSRADRRPAPRPPRPRRVPFGAAAPSPPAAPRWTAAAPSAVQLNAVPGGCGTLMSDPVNVLSLPSATVGGKIRPMAVTTRTLGRSGIEVSGLGMGCWAIGGPWPTTARSRLGNRRRRRVGAGGPSCAGTRRHVFRYCRQLRRRSQRAGPGRALGAARSTRR